MENSKWQGFILLIILMDSISQNADVAFLLNSSDLFLKLFFLSNILFFLYHISNALS